MTDEISAEEQVKIFLRYFLLVVVGVVLLGIISVYIHRSVDTQDLEHVLLTQRLLYSKDCFSYQEGRSYPGIIDLGKFQEEQLQQCAFKERIGYKLTLQAMDGTLLKTVGINKNLIPFLDFCSVNKKNFQCYHDRAFVLVQDQSILKNAFLNIDMVIKDA